MEACVTKPGRLIAMVHTCMAKHRPMTMLQHCDLFHKAAASKAERSGAKASYLLHRSLMPLLYAQPRYYIEKIASCLKISDRLESMVA
jgi:hypothetical protein